jgi:hypothetical protein
MIYQEPFVYCDQFGIPLAGGTAIEDRTTLIHHQAIIAYRYGEQVVIENSFRHRQAVVIPSIQFKWGQDRLARANAERSAARRADRSESLC